VDEALWLVVAAEERVDGIGHRRERVITENLDVEELVLGAQRIGVLTKIVRNLARPALAEGFREDEPERQVRPLSFQDEHHLEEVRGDDLRMLSAACAEPLDKLFRSRIGRSAYQQLRSRRRADLSGLPPLTPNAAEEVHTRMISVGRRTQNESRRVTFANTGPGKRALAAGERTAFAYALLIGPLRAPLSLVV
jgi:hypothetical protein